MSLPITRRSFLRTSGLAGTAALTLGCPSIFRKRRPNILLAIADDWSWPHASVLGEPVIQTPTFDRVVREGVLFRNAFVSAPSCTPSRGSILSGQDFWRLRESADLWSTLPVDIPVYPDLLEKAGYHVGFSRKGWGPGRIEPGGRKRNPAGPQFGNFEVFLKARPKGAPFCFWFGSHDPHRPYERGIGVRSGMDPSQVRVPPYLPDSPEVRSDLCDYFWEVQRFDRDVGHLLEILEDIGELDNTIVVVTSDNGMPFPRAKANVYDGGTRVPLAIRWGDKVDPGREVLDFINLADLAPTFLEAAGLKPPEQMNRPSFLNVLTSRRSGQIDPARTEVVVGRERHAWVRKNGLGYPMRAIRTAEYLYIWNPKPDRWPAGDPEGTEAFSWLGPFGDVDPSPTKDFMLSHRDDPEVAPLFALAFDKRPEEELYVLKEDPYQLHNVAQKYPQLARTMKGKLERYLREAGDPRVAGKGDVFDLYPYYGGGRVTVPKRG